MIDKLADTVGLFKDDTGTQFWISKHATIIMKKGIIWQSKGIQLPNYEAINN